MKILTAVQAGLSERGAVLAEVNPDSPEEVIRELAASESQRLALLIQLQREQAMGWPAPYEPERSHYWEQAS